MARTFNQTLFNAMTQSRPLFALVVLDAALDRPLDYEIPSSLQEDARLGSRVEVNMRGKLQKGYIIEIKQASLYSTVKPIEKVLDEASIPSDLFQLARWISSYYCTPLRDVFRVLLPPSIRKGMEAKEQFFVERKKSKEELCQVCIAIREKSPKQAAILDEMLLATKGLFLSVLLEKTGAPRSAVLALVKKECLDLKRVVVERSPLVGEEYFISPPKQLNSEQHEALESIKTSIESGSFQTHLLYGITGSGKTEVYLQAIDYVLKKGKSAIMLVPEISLTGQTIDRFKSRFEEKIAILHHRLSEGERKDAWHQIQKGEARIVIGARSAIFSPVMNLGLIIVDEEHESSYKQNDASPCYHGRDVAVMRAKLTESAVILGSATPSLESYYNAKKGKYKLNTLEKRAESSELPKVTIVDMKKEFEKAKRYTNFSEALLDQIKLRLEKGEQTILFLNRRGYYHLMLCTACGKTVQCPHCDASMTFHLADNRLACHLCGFEHSPPLKHCPSCKGQDPLKFRGAGTEQIEKALHAIFPDIRTLRLDADTTKHKGSHQKILGDFGSGKADLLIGTQMIAKGLHFPGVTLVGILNSDSALNIPDFRASETVFQLITQVAGRAGRGLLSGEVIIQSSIPDNSTILHASRQDFLSFYAEEIEVRNLFCYPPFCHIAKMVVSGKCVKETHVYAEKIREALLQLLPKSFEFHPVVPSGHAKVKDTHRFQFILRGETMSHLHKAIQAIKEKRIYPSSIRLSVDVNPTSTFF